LEPLARFVAGGAGARPDHSIRRAKNDDAEPLSVAMTAGFANALERKTGFGKDCQ
jgi:hypothetical protein